MLIKPYTTRVLTPPKDNLEEAIKQSIDKIKENSVVCISSKIVSIGEGRCVPINEVNDKDQLIRDEADYYLSRDLVPKGWIMHTINKGVLIPTAGIDESNADDHYILWPKNPDRSAKKLWKFLRHTYDIANLGVVLTDSHSIPLRRGLVGFCLAYFGFEPLNDYRGKKDLFGREIKTSQTNIPDSLASAAVLAMGEGDESSPVVVISDLPKTTFTNRRYSSHRPYSSYQVSMQEDLYQPFLTSVKWKSKN